MLNNLVKLINRKDNIMRYIKGLTSETLNILTRIYKSSNFPQVFTLDSDGNPIKLTDVTKIEAVDLSSIFLTEVSYEDTKLSLKQPLRLTPTMDEESSQLFVVEDNNINLHVFAYTREDLIHEINEQIVMMWDEYVKESIEGLASDARELREILLNTLEEIN